MPVLSFFETVFLINLFIDRRTHDGNRLSLQGIWICQLIALDKRSRALRLIIVVAVKQIQPRRCFDRMRVNGKRRQELFYLFEHPGRRIGNRNPHRLSVLILAVCIETGIVHVIFSVQFDHARCPAFLLPGHVQTAPLIFPALF